MKRLLGIFLFPCMAVFGATQALNELVYKIRDPKTGASNFRHALEKIGEYLALDVLEELRTKEMTVCTLTGKEATHCLVDEAPILVTILRAGLPLNAGLQNVFPESEVGFLAMARDEETLKARVDYIALPNLRNKTVILSDTMLATGGSLIDAIRIIEQRSPERIILVVAIASEPGIQRIYEHNPKIQIFAAAIDPFLNEKGYIIPGLGDAGDRCFGKK